MLIVLIVVIKIYFPTFKQKKLEFIKINKNVSLIGTI